MAHQLDRHRAWIVSLVFVLGVLHLSEPVNAEYREVEDIKPFGILDVGGFFRAGYYMDERGYIESSERRATLQEQIYLSTKVFFYHPGLVNMEVGGGPIFLQQRFDEISGETQQRDTLFDFLARVNILDVKSYPVSVWYGRSHPAVTTGLAGRFLTQSDEYGMRGHVGQLLRGSTTLRYTLSQRDDEGSGFGAVVDNSFDVRSFETETHYGRSNRLNLIYHNSNLDSASGSAGLPIVRSTLSLESSEVNAINVFGAQRQIRLHQVLHNRIQDRSSTMDTRSDTTTYRANLNWRKSEKVRTNFRYRQARDLRESSTDFRTETRDAELSVVYSRDSDFYVTTGAEFSSEEQVGFNRDESAIRGQAHYARPTSFGSWSVSTSLRGARADQEASAGTILVFDEQHILAGASQSTLRNDFVVEDSIVVNNDVQTQIYVEGIDYRVVTVGSMTSIQRLIDGNIEDGESVLVDYVFETSGTAEFDTLDSSTTLNIEFLQSMNTFVRYGLRDTRIRDGELSNQINDGRALEYGFGVNNQFLDGWSMSGQYRHLDWDEDISPSTQDNLSLALNTQLLGTWKLVMSFAINKVDFEESIEDVDQTTYRLGISGRPVRGGIFSYDVSHLEDDGGSLPRKQMLHRLRFQWTYRQLRLNTSAAYSADMQGDSERDNTMITAQITRLF